MATFGMVRPDACVAVGLARSALELPDLTVGGDRAHICSLYVLDKTYTELYTLASWPLLTEKSPTYSAKGKARDDMSDKGRTGDWPELAIGLYDKLTGRGAEITYEMENLAVEVPASAAPDAPRAKWVLNGSLRIRTRDRQEG
jgi:hypothetical protein